MSCVAGLDIGSAMSKAVIMQNGTLISASVRATEGDFGVSADGVLAAALQKAKLTHSDIKRIGACGLGVKFISQPFTKITEISCQSRGVHYLIPTVRTLIEVGNQSSRVIKVSPKGKVADCLVSDKCAAGSGRILQIIAKVLGITIEEMGKLSLQATQPAKFTTGCAVFLETEAISRVAEGMAKEDIIAGLHHTLAARIGAMAQRMRVEDDCAFTGGGAVDIGFVKIMEKRIGKKITTPEDPLITAAIGAALIAAEK